MFKNCKTCAFIRGVDIPTCGHTGERVWSFDSCEWYKPPPLYVINAVMDGLVAAFKVMDAAFEGIARAVEQFNAAYEAADKDNIPCGEKVTDG